MPFRPGPHKPRNELGVALLAGLVLLAGISLLALVAAGSMFLQQRMAANFADSIQARQAAALAVTRGEAFLFGIRHDGRTATCLRDCFSPPLDRIILPLSAIPLHPEFEDNSWWRARATDAGTKAIGRERKGETWSFGSEPPRFLIEEIYFDTPSQVTTLAGAPPVAGVGYYRILGRGVGRGPAAVAVDEAIVARPWPKAPSPGSSPGNERDFCTAFKPWYDCGPVAWRQLR